MHCFPLSVACLLISASVQCALAVEFVPAVRHENIEAQDSSIQRCFVFTAKPGVLYRVERSNDLSDWTTTEEIYGLGHEHVTAMIQQTAPPPPPPGGSGGSPSATGPMRVVGLQIRPSSATVGGTVVSWRSLDTGTAMSRLLDIEMTQEWNSMPLFADQHDNHFFFIAIPGLATVAPPVEEIPLGTLDAAMWEDLETHFPAMNQAVVDSVAAARLQPPPPPPDPDSRRFWRVFSDWSLDTDQDGSPDWMEFEIAARNPSAGGLDLRGDAFDADTNRNGIRDGEELDFDEDGVNDDIDAGKGDATVTVMVGPVPRYALFPITNAQPPSEWPDPFQINDRGTVLYANGSWRAGGWTTLLDEGASLENATARAINDNDVILGYANNTEPAMVHSQFCIWGSAAVGIAPTGIITADAPARVATTMNDTSGGPGYDVIYGLLTPGPVLSNEGRFCMGTSRWNGETYEFSGYGVWTIPQSGQTAATWEEGTRGLRYTGPNGLRWGHKPLANNPFMFDGGLVISGGQSLELPFVPRNVAQLPQGRLLAMPGDGLSAALVHSNGGWEPSPTFAAAIDIFDAGRAIGRNQLGLVSPISINGKWQSIERTAPGLHEDWKSHFTSLADTSAGGWILARREDADPNAPKEAAVLLPIEIKGYPVADGLAPGATAVDEFSIGAISPGPAVGDKLWVMAPASVGQSRFRLKAPLNAETPLKLSGGDLRFDGATSETLIAPSTDVLIESWTSPPQSHDTVLNLSFGNTASASNPVGVKIMKDRIVRVKPFLVTLDNAAGPDNPPDIHPTRVDLDHYLNAVFRTQLNATIIVEPLTLIDAAWDTNGNQSLDSSGLNATGSELDAILNAASSHVGSDMHIKVFIIGSEKKIQFGEAWGIAVRNANSCWVIGEAMAQEGVAGSGRIVYDVMQTIAHEIGHIFVDYGHPDQGGGVAPLFGTDHRERLMHSGEGLGGATVGGVYMRNRREHRLVKAEWDAADVWLKTEIDDKEPQ